MTKFSLIRPLDQPLGTRRLLQYLKAALKNKRFTHFWLIVAYAKSGPLYRLQELMEAWSAAGKTSAAIFGVDQRGTSRDALELALTLFDCVYVTQEAGITFHPKIYLFKGKHHAQAFVGSNNLTVGGTEKNFEAAVHLELNLPEDAADLATFESAWTELLPASCPATTQLDANFLAQLIADNVVVAEKTILANGDEGDEVSVGRGQRRSSSGLAIKPESSLPKKVLSRPQTTQKQTFPAMSVPAQSVNVRGFAIQIKPHHNGEIFLSVTAALQNPAFFGLPFKGRTTPKKPGNRSYPQLVPDPVVNITVFGAGSVPVLELSEYSLNTVHYTKKSEIRITASPLVDVVPEYSIMIMERSSVPGISYEIAIQRPDSPEYGAWVSACNQSMPGGGKPPRKYGWF